MVESCLGILPGLLETTHFNTDRMAELANANFATATELANHLARERGIPFRECHEIVGGVVGDLVKKGKPFADWEETQKLLQRRGIDLAMPQIKQVLDSKLALQNNQSLGGTSPAEVERMTGEFEGKLEKFDVGIQARRDQIGLAYQQTHRIIQTVLAGNATADLDL